MYRQEYNFKIFKKQEKKPDKVKVQDIKPRLESGLSALIYILAENANK